MWIKNSPRVRLPGENYFDWATTNRLNGLFEPVLVLAEAGYQVASSGDKLATKWQQSVEPIEAT